MRKLYLFITAALLIGNLSVFAEVIATVGSTEFDTESYEGSTSKTLKAALYASSADNKAILQKNFILDKDFSIEANKQCYLDMNGKEIEHANWFFDVYGLFDVSGTGTLHNTGTNNDGIFWIWGGTNPQEPYNRILNIGKNVTLRSDAGYGVIVYGTKSGSKRYGYGVEVNINGNFQTPNGITINGSVNQTTGNVPIINIGDNAVITGGCGDKAAIYAAGYGIWNIGAATLNAGTPIYAKAGQININGATIEACGEYAEPQPYGNGFYGTGDGIVFDSKNGYAGNMSIAITDATITSANGYAIQEVLTDRESSATIGMTIVNGAFAGAKGAVVVSEDFSGSAEDGSNQQGEWVLNAVTGGKYSTKPAVVADGYEVVVTSDAKFPYSVQPKQEPTFLTTTEITENTAFDDITVDASQRIIIKNGATVTVSGNITIGTDKMNPSQIVIEPGSTLIAGSGGIIMNNNLGAQALVIKSDNSGNGVLLFNGTENTNPLATTEMYLHGHKYDDSEGADTDPNNYKWQHFGLPVEAEGAEIEKTMGVFYYDWVTNTGWVASSGAAVKAGGPWKGHNVTTSAMTEGGIFKFKGQLVGAEDTPLNMEHAGYFCFANSYTAPISISSLVEKIDAAAKGSLWFYDASDDIAHFQIYDIYETSDPSFVDNGVPAMQAFYIHNKNGENTSINVNYVDDVYGFIPASGSTRGADVSMNGGKITLSDGVEGATFTIRESDEFSDEVGQGDVEQMETGMIQIYGLQGTSKLATMATNDIDNKEIAIKTKSRTEFTLKFSNLVGNGFRLFDDVTNNEIEVVEGGTYTFSADANSTITRFHLGKGVVSANEADADAVSIYTADDVIYVKNNAAQADIEVINLSGVTVTVAKVNGEAVQALPVSGLAEGIYIVRVGAATLKMVK